MFIDDILKELLDSVLSLHQMYHQHDHHSSTLTLKLIYINVFLFRLIWSIFPIYLFFFLRIFFLIFLFLFFSLFWFFLLLFCLLLFIALRRTIWLFLRARGLNNFRVCLLVSFWTSVCFSRLELFLFIYLGDVAVKFFEWGSGQLGFWF